MLIYDCEIVKAIKGKEKKIPGVEYCEGWDDFDGMGISVICAYEYPRYVSVGGHMHYVGLPTYPGKYRVFMADNFSEFQDTVLQHELIIGFNNLRFDNRLCEANGLSVPDEKSYDILQELWLAAGLGPEFDKTTHAHFGLDAVCTKNFPRHKKTGHGAMAPVLWQKGQAGQVIDYCLNDVYLTKLVFEQILQRGWLKDPRPDHRRKLSLRRPRGSARI